MAGAFGVKALELRDVRASYGPYRALNGLTLSVDPGEFVALLGRNGAGKSTLARVVSGLVPIDSGEVEVLGSPIRRVSTSRLARRGIVHLPEGVGLFSGLTVEENLILRVGGKDREQRRSRLERAFTLLGPLSERRHAKAGQLSGGQQRLVAVSGAIAAEPALLVADEPALGLSPAAADDVYDAMEALRSTSTAVIIIETRLGRVEQLCDRGVIMNNGVSVFDGPIVGAHEALTKLLLQPSSSTDSEPRLFDVEPPSVASERDPVIDDASS